MAKLDFLNAKRGHLLFYNVDAAVGNGCPNRKDDVVLVQYLLKNASTLAFPDTFKWNLLNYPINGIWDRNWHALLGVFTEKHQELGNRAVADKRVHPVPNGKLLGPVHRAQYMIVSLNLYYALGRKADYPKMAEVSDCPAELRDVLKWKVLDNR